MFYGRCAVLILVGAGGCTAAMADADLSTTVELGYRVDSLDWNIAGDQSGHNPNILSELSWTHLAIPQARLNLEGGAGRVRLLGSASYGRIASGDNRDSDYILDNRQGEFSRSNNQAKGDVRDVSVGLGYLFPMGDEDGSNSYAVPMVGFSLHQQNLQMTDGYQTVDLLNTPPALGPFAGLDSSYDAQWQGGWLGVRFGEENLKRGLKVALDIAYHWVDYQAEADWNLRPDFAHPKSFEHKANGRGLAISLNGLSMLSKHWGWTWALDYSLFRATNGTDTVHTVNQTDGSIQSFKTRLNEVNWESFSLNLGVALRI